MVEAKIYHQLYGMAALKRHFNYYKHLASEASEKKDNEHV